MIHAVFRKNLSPSVSTKKLYKMQVERKALSVYISYYMYQYCTEKCWHQPMVCALELSVLRKFCMYTLCFFQRFRKELGLGFRWVLHPCRIRNASFGVRLFDRSDRQPSFHGQGCIHILFLIICTILLYNLKFNYFSQKCHVIVACFRY